MSESLVDAYDLVILDLDGVVYLIDQPIPGAAGAVTALRERGVPVAYATNNASRRPGAVADLLVRLGVPADAGEVLTSAQAAAAALAERHPPGSPVLVVGAEALRAEVRDAGLIAVDAGEPTPRAVVQGYGRDVGWPQLAEACVAVLAGADWVATNTDATLPSARGPLPGNGALVAAIRTAVGREPDLVVGKPAPGLFSIAAGRVGARRPLVVGDRLDTDIEGAVRAGMDSMLVLTGITSPRMLLQAPPEQRPTYVAADLSGLFTVDSATRVPPGAGQGGWVARRRDGTVRLHGHGSALDALRTLCAVAWSSPAAHGVTRHGPPAAWGVAGEGPQAAETLRRLGLAGTAPAPTR